MNRRSFLKFIPLAAPAAAVAAVKGNGDDIESYLRHHGAGAQCKVCLGWSSITGTTNYPHPATLWTEEYHVEGCPHFANNGRKVVLT